MEKGMTRVQCFETLKTIVEQAVADEALATELITFIDKQVDALARKNEKAKETAAAKRAATDTLKGIVADVLTDEPQLIDEILAQVEVEGVTRNKVVSRLGALAREHVAVKEYTTVEKRRIAAYRLANDSDTFEEE